MNSTFATLRLCVFAGTPAAIVYGANFHAKAQSRKEITIDSQY
jgi:hypothetical protein